MDELCVLSVCDGVCVRLFDGGVFYGGVFYRIGGRYYRRVFVCCYVILICY